MKNLLTGAARSVTDTNERARKLFENRPMETPVQRERQNRPRKTFAKAAAEVEEAEDDETPETEALEEAEATELDGAEAIESDPAGDDAKDE